MTNAPCVGRGSSEAESDGAHSGRLDAVGFPGRNEQPVVTDAFRGGNIAAGTGRVGVGN
ncbi:MAG: hypothetical protein J4F30_02865 [Acidobacteria bacterium]|nr:hypothetical protein [Acidobacteriota bacterium]